MQSITASAPGRICLFGEHQDYLGLPVIAAAVDLRIEGSAKLNIQNQFAINMPDIGESVTIDPNVPQAYGNHRDYLRSSITILRRLGVSWPLGLDITIGGNIPINAGVSSSSAMTVMWIRLLLEAGQNSPEFDSEQIARWAFAAEVTEFGDPGGMMDHFCAAVGGVLHIDTRPPFSAKSLAFPREGFVIGHSLEPKATLETLGSRRREVQLGIDQLKSQMPHFDLATTPLSDCETSLKHLDAVPRKRLLANLKNRDITQSALNVIEGHDAVKFGQLLYQHHLQLRDGLELSTPKLESMLDASMTAGALGGKVNGSGGGGTMFAFAPGKQEAVADAIRSVGGVPYIVSVDKGVRIHL